MPWFQLPTMCYLLWFPKTTSPHGMQVWKRNIYATLTLISNSLLVIWTHGLTVNNWKLNTFKAMFLSSFWMSCKVISRLIKKVQGLVVNMNRNLYLQCFANYPGPLQKSRNWTFGFHNWSWGKKLIVDNLESVNFELHFQL